MWEGLPSEGFLPLRAEGEEVAPALREEVTVASEILPGNFLQALWRLRESGGCGPSHVLVLFREERNHSSGY